MSLLFETIKLEDGSLHNLVYHNERINKSREELFGVKEKIDLKNILFVPQNCLSGIYKCRVTYNQEIIKIEWEKYVPKKIEKLIVVNNNEIEYSYKYSDRKIFNQLKREVNSGPNDDILIVKKGFVTDTSYSNIVFFDNNNWFTPAKPLLKGVQRRRLLANCLIQERDIKVDEINGYKYFKLINAMLNFELSPMYSTEIILK